MSDPSQTTFLQAAARATDEERDEFIRWIEAGAPVGGLGAQAAHPPSPSPQPAPDAPPPWRKDIDDVHKEIETIKTDLAAVHPAPEPISDELAWQLAAIINAFDADTYAVYRLYCVEGNSAAQTAWRRGCSKATIINRLRIIRQKTGRDPRQLRPLASHLDRIEASLSDPRARRIDRRRAMDQPDDQDDAPD